MLFYPYTWLLYFQGVEFLSNLHTQFWRLLLVSSAAAMKSENGLLSGFHGDYWSQMSFYSLSFIYMTSSFYLSWSWQNYLCPSVLFMVRSIFILHPGCLVGSFNLQSLPFSSGKLSWIISLMIPHLFFLSFFIEFLLFRC